MPYSIRHSQIGFSGYRVLALLFAFLLVLPFVELITQAADETVVVVDTDRTPKSGHPIYVIAVPRQQKLAPRPLDIPIISTRSASTAGQTDPEVSFPAFTLSVDQAVRIGNGLIEDAEFQLALPYFQEAQKQELQKQQSNSLGVLNGLAHCYYGLKRDNEALAIYKEVAAQNTAFWAAQFNVGRMHLENGRYAEAVAALNEALKLKPDDPETSTSLGIALTKNGQGADAIPHLTRVANLDRYVKESFYNLGEAYAVDQQWLKAADTFKYAAGIRGTDPEGYYYWGVMLFNADKLDEAFDAFQKVRQVDITAKHVGAAFYIAEIYRLRGKLQDALGQYQVVLKLKPDDVESLFQAGYLSFQLGQVDPAKDLFKKLIDVSPLHAGGAANWAAIEARFNEIRKSRKEKTPGITLREVAQANPDSVEAHINLGAQLITEEVYAEAVTVLQRAVTLRPNSPAAQYNFGLALLKTGDYERAITANTKALEFKPNWPDAYNNLGLAYAGLKRWEEAARAYREAVRIVPNYAGAYLNLGIASVRLGQLDFARQLVEKLKPMSWAHQAELAHEILAVERGGAIITANNATPAAPQPTTTDSPANPVTENKTASPAETQAPSPSPLTDKPTTPVTSESKVTPTLEGKAAPPSSPPVQEECPEPIYRQSGVTQMASIIGLLEFPYTDEAIQNNVEGKIVLKAVLCGNGRVSDISVEERLPFGLTERAIEALKKMQFQPAVRDSQPVSVIVSQTFYCAQRVCSVSSR